MSTSIVTGIIRAIGLGADVFDIFDTASNLPNTTAGEKIQLITKIASTTLSACSLGREVSGCPIKEQRVWNLVEIWGNRAVAIPEIFLEAEKIFTIPNYNLDLFSEKLLSSIMKEIRLEAKRNALIEKEYLSLPEAECKNIKRPIYAHETYDEGEGIVKVEEKIVGYTPFDKEKSQNVFDKALETEHRAGILEAIGKTHLISKTSALVSKAVPHAIQALTNFVHFTNDVRLHLRQLLKKERFDLLKSPIIPEEFHPDAVFSRHICPITGIPIRHPVEEPVSGIIYEREWIENWIDRHHTNPTTGGVLEKTSLLVRGDLEGEIDDRLQEYQDDLNLFNQKLQMLDRKLN